LKAASTDALKKCASEIGIANDIYGADEFKGIQEQPRAVQKKIPEAKTEVNYLNQVKIILKKDGANTEKQALSMIKKRTGIVWKDFKVTQKQSQIVLGKLLNN